MKKFAVALALGVALGGSAACVPVLAQSPAPTAPAPAGPKDHAKLEAAIKQLELRPRQKMEIARILRTAKENGQDRAVTMKQVAGVLTPEQKAKLMDMMKDAGPPKKQAPKP